jgi:ubiquinone/menaquinone biosynthesis C-methylase UbiE
MMSDDRLKARVRNEYDARAATYEQRWRHYVAATVRETIRRIPRGGVASLLDVGCGTGTLLAAFAAEEPECAIAGVDLSPVMLAAAARRLPARARLVAADAEHLPFDDEAFDVVVSSSSFHFWPDPLAGLVECRRVLRRGGRLVITDWCDDFLLCRVCDRLLRLRYGAAHRVYGAGDCERLLLTAGFEAPRIERYKVSWLWGVMTAVATVRG